MRVFINYRRKDTGGYAGRLFDALTAHSPQWRVFMDIDTIDVGADFVDVIDRTLGECEAVVALIGRSWLSPAEGGGEPRLFDPGDFVRLELEGALSRGVMVIPALVQDAPMPGPQDLPDSLKPLARRNAIELSDERWRYDVGRLIQALERAAQVEAPAPEPAPTAKRRRPRRVAALVAALVALVAGAVVGVVVATSGSGKPHRQGSSRTNGPAQLLKSSSYVDSFGTIILYFGSALKPVPTSKSVTVSAFHVTIDGHAQPYSFVEQLPSNYPHDGISLDPPTNLQISPSSHVRVAYFGQFLRFANGRQIPPFSLVLAHS